MSFPKFPGLSAPISLSELIQWARSINQCIETLTGSRGSERVATASELKLVQDVVDKLTSAKREVKPGDITIDIGGGLTASVSLSQLVEKLVADKRMQAAFAASNSATSAANSTDSSGLTRVQQMLQSEVDAAAQVASAAKSDAASAKKTADEAIQLALKSSGGGRGSIVGYGSLGYFQTNAWRDEVAIYVVQESLGLNRAGVVPSASDTANLVIGDMVTLTGIDGTTSHTRQWLGPSAGWVDCGSFLTGLAIKDGSIPKAKVASLALQVIDSMFGTYAGSYYINGATTVNYGGRSLDNISSKTPV